MNLELAEPAVVETLGKDVQGLLTGQKTVAQTLADLDAAWGTVGTAHRPGDRRRLGGRLRSPSRVRSTAPCRTCLSTLRPLVGDAGGPAGRCRGSGSSRPSPWCSRSGTSRRAPARGTRSPTGTGSAGTRPGSGSTTSARSSTTRAARGALKHTLELAFAFVIISNVIGLALALATPPDAQDPRPPARDLLPAGRDELARRLVRLAVHLQLRRSAQQRCSTRIGLESLQAAVDGRPDVGAVDDLRRPRLAVRRPLDGHVPRRAWRGSPRSSTRRRRSTARRRSGGSGRSRCRYSRPRSPSA